MYYLHIVLEHQPVQADLSGITLPLEELFCEALPKGSVGTISKELLVLQNSFFPPSNFSTAFTALFEGLVEFSCAECTASN